MTTKDEFCIGIRQAERAMYSLAFSIVRNEQDACDVISESILRAYSRLDTLKNDHAFRAWILRIVHNTAIEMIRKKADTVDIDACTDIADTRKNVDITTKLTLLDAIEKLQQPYRTAVILFYYEDLSVAEIASTTGTSVVAVRQHLSRARKQLKQLLKKEDFFE